MEKRSIVIAGIGTEIGKTISSAIVCEAFKTDYWKPIQAGELSLSDTAKVEQLVSNSVSHFHQESFALQEAMSPHEAANRENRKITVDSIKIPSTSNHLVIEMAGGLMVPINNEELLIDFIAKHKFEVILVSQYYLGSINHTLLSLHALKTRGIELSGLIFNGKKVPSTFDIIMKHTDASCLLEIDYEEQFTPEVIKKYADRFKK